MNLDDIEQELSEKRFEEQVREAEITALDAVTRGSTVYLRVRFETVIGEEVAEELPMPERYHPAYSDLATIVEFVGETPSDLESLKGQTVPYHDGRVKYATMRKVLEMEREAADDWDAEKRREKAQEVLD